MKYDEVVYAINPPKKSAFSAAIGNFVDAEEPPSWRDGWVIDETEHAIKILDRERRTWIPISWRIAAGDAKWCDRSVVRIDIRRSA